MKKSSSNIDEVSLQPSIVTKKSDKKSEKPTKEKSKGAKVDDTNKISKVGVIYDIDEVVKEILEKENMEVGKMIYEPKGIHIMNKEFVDEYVDEDDPGFDTYVVNEENFVESCQELAKLNSFPVRAIKNDTKHDLAFRERARKKIELEKEKNKVTKSNTKKMKNNDSALLLQELSKKKKRGEDVDDDDLEQLK